MHGVIRSSRLCKLRGSWQTIPAMAVCLIIHGCSAAGITKPISAEQDQTQQRSANELLPSSAVVTINHHKLPEISGLAASVQNPGTLWALNDSGNSPSLFAVTKATGSVSAEFRTTVSNRDWESLSAFQHQGKSYLVIADIGDNRRSHRHYRLHVFAEPVLPANTAVRDGQEAETIKPITTVRFSYPDKPRNSEAIAVISAATALTGPTVLIIEKSGQAPAVHGVPLELSNYDDEIVIARPITVLEPPPVLLTDRLITELTGISMSQITGAEIADNGSSLIVLTYRGVYRYKLPEHGLVGNDTRLIEPETLLRHTLNQAEALAINPQSNTVYITSEKLPTPVLRVELGLPHTTE